ncbi:glycosyltransferase [Marinigracilibium pacificum]|uniref:Glycosyltransferase n=1 Tax=Marinigracilibium pacificum TaxID=2729599 RepID=A0A848IZG8_9BACT|nr:nucleotide disphospho-sugar-binding domain-containing protein [Marinigracilibium pacificum]NMM49933.1 glycosyltransferase [Marinigracilibium pacificum]
MKILLTAIGSRGDIEPFLAIGDLLVTRGYNVTCLFPEQFRDLVVNSNMRFETLGPEFIELLDSDLGKSVMGSDLNQVNKIRSYIKLAKVSREINKKMFQDQIDVINEINPDKIVYHPKTLYPVIWEIKKPGSTIMVSPVPYLHYVKGHTHLAFNSNYGEFLNKMTFKIAEFGLLQTIMTSLKWVGEKRINKNQVKSILKNRSLIYSISPQLFKIENNEKIKVLGYRQRKSKSDWEPDTKLIDFLNNHKKILFITFGSMTNPEPEKKTKIFMDVLAKNNIPAIFNTASGGLVEPGFYDHNLFHFVSEIPYDWIFKKVYAVIHHGGSGTTHMGLKFGCPTLIIPHIIDQFLWNKLIYDAGAGPKGDKIGKITPEKLEPKILGLMLNASYKEKAVTISENMKKEDYDNEILNLIDASDKIHTVS